MAPTRSCGWRPKRRPATWSSAGPAPAVAADHLLVGITGGFQPDKLARSFEGDSDGTRARVLLAWPEEPAFRRPSGRGSEVEPELLTAFGRIIDLPAGEEVRYSHLVPVACRDAQAFEQFRNFCTGKGA